MHPTVLVTRNAQATQRINAATQKLVNLFELESPLPEVQVVRRGHAQSQAIVDMLAREAVAKLLEELVTRVAARVVDLSHLPEQAMPAALSAVDLPPATAAPEAGLVPVPGDAGGLGMPADQGPDRADHVSTATPGAAGPAVRPRRK